MIGIIAAFVAWLYKRVANRLGLPALRLEEARTITPTQILLALLLVVMLANHLERADLKKAIVNVDSSIVDLHNSGIDNTDEIKSSLDDVKNAVEAMQ